MKEIFNYTSRNRSFLQGKLQLLWRCAMVVVAVFIVSIDINAQSPVIDGKPADWPNALNGVSNVSAFKRDANASNDDQFTQGSSDDKIMSAWRWNLGQTNKKGDISNAGAVLTTDNKLYFFGDRTSTSGAANIGFWFFKNDVKMQADGTFSGDHADGDILILTNFTNGGTKPSIEVWKWNAVTNAPQFVTLINSSLDGDGAVNTGLETVPNYTYPKTGQQWTYSSADNAAVAGMYHANVFYEGMVDLGRLSLDPCFTSFILETRNSPSISASQQDLAFGEFDTKPEVTINNVTVCAGGDATFTANVTAGTGLPAFQYRFKVGNGDYGAYSTTKTFTINGATASTTVTVQVKGSNGCESIPASGILSIIPSPTISGTPTPVSCNGGNNGKITPSGTNFDRVQLWSAGADQIMENADDSQVGSNTDGSAFINLTAGKYYLKAFNDYTVGNPPVDQNCPATSGVITITQPAALTLSLDKTDVSCNGGSNGTVTATFGGGSGNYQARIDGGTWADATSPKVFSGLSAGSHTVDIRDKADVNCTKSASITVGQPNQLSISASGLNPTCDNLSSGSISGTITGGTTPYKVSIDNFANFITSTDGNYSFIGLAGGSTSYTVKVRDANYGNGSGCEASASPVTLTVPECYGHIFPTGTDCDEYREQTASELEQLCYSYKKVKGKNTVQQDVTPGQFMYYTSIQASGTFTVDIVQTHNAPQGSNWSFAGVNQVFGYDSNCNKIADGTTTSSGQASITFNNVPEGATVYIRVMYDPKSIAGSTFGSAVPTVTHSFVSNIEGAEQAGSAGSIDVVNCQTQATTTATSSSALEGIKSDQMKAYPTPFSDKARIEFTTSRTENFVVNLYDMKGGLVKQLKAGTGKAGELQVVEVDGKGLNEGLYIARMISDSGARSVKLLLKRE